MSEELTEDQKLLRKATDSLREHFDSVQIFVTRVEGDNTMNGEHGAGDWFARYGMVKQWIFAQEQRIKKHATDEISEQ